MPSGYIGGTTNPDVTWWQDRVREGMAWRKMVAFEESWYKWHQYYRGEWDSGVMPVNLFFQLMRSIVPRVYFRNPSVSITSSKPGALYMGFAKLLERTDEKLMRQMRLKNELKRMTADSFLYGTAVGTLGFGAIHEYEHAGYVESPLLGRHGEAVEYQDFVNPNMPWFSRVHPRNYVVPLGTEVHHTARWTAQIVERNVEDVKADTRLSNARKNVGPGRFNELNQSAQSKARSAKLQSGGMHGRHADKTVELAVIRDKKFRMVHVLGPSSGNKTKPEVLYSGTDALQGSGFPDFTMSFNPDPEYFWGVPDSQILEPYQKDINEARTQLMQHRRLALRKWLVRKGAMEESEIKKLLSSDPAAVAFVKGNPTTSVLPTQLGDIPQSLFSAIEQDLRDMRESVGFSRNQLGEFNSQTADTTATEAQIVQAASEIRVDERRDMIADLLVDIVEGMHNLIFRHWTTTEVVDVVGPGGIPIWVQFTPQMLALGQYNVKIDPDSSLPETKQAREVKALALYERLKTNPIIDPFKLTQYLLHELHGTAFDDMMRQLPQQNVNGPVNASEYGGILQNAIGQQNPQQLIEGLSQQAQGAG